MIEAGFFDLDKTTIDPKGRAYDGLEAAFNSSTETFARTILTARGYPRLQEAIGDNPFLAVSPGFPIGLENGARIVDSDTFENIYYHPLSIDERAAICDYITTTEELRYVAFHPEEPRSKTMLWSPDPDEAERLHNAYSHNADVFSGDKQMLFQKINQHTPCMITCRTYSNEPRDLPEITFYSRNTTVNFMPEQPNKGTALQMIADRQGLDLSNVMAAGNDHNDIPMLSVEHLGYPVVVGTDMSEVMKTQLPEKTLYIPDPRKLGSYILKEVTRQ